MKMYNRDEIYNHLSGEEVAERLNLPMSYENNMIWVLCPDHTHNDEHFGSCVITEYGCHCFVCDKTYNLEAMLMEVLGVTFPKAIEILAGWAGVIPEKNNISLRENVFLPFTKEEFEFIGIKNLRVEGAINAQGERIPKQRKKRDSDGNYIILDEMCKSPLKELYKTDKELFFSIIENKLDEKMESVNRCLEDFTNGKEFLHWIAANVELDMEGLKIELKKIRKQIFELKQKCYNY